ncbi:MAG TPA: hemerythrin domain-containing protein [Acidimicrobiales bacterium]|nr:hemerythrin domain-containing protein [Acidimicrobiales bacterium]
MSASDTNTQTDAIELLTSDHRAVDQLFAQIGSQPEGVQKDDLVKLLTRDLSVHAAIEEQILYPVMRRSLSDGDAKVEEAIQEHQSVKETLAEIERLGSSPQRDQPLQTLMNNVRHHVEEEENEVFPELRGALSSDELQAMGTALAAAKKLAPTHPHPNAPTTPPGNVVAGVAAAVMDKARDAVQGN